MIPENKKNVQENQKSTQPNQPNQPKNNLGNTSCPPADSSDSQKIAEPDASKKDLGKQSNPNSIKNANSSEGKSSSC